MPTIDFSTTDKAKSATHSPYLSFRRSGISVAVTMAVMLGLTGCQTTGSTSACGCSAQAQTSDLLATKAPTDTDDRSTAQDDETNKSDDGNTTNTDTTTDTISDTSSTDATSNLTAHNTDTNQTDTTKENTKATNIPATTSNTENSNINSTTTTTSTPTTAPMTTQSRAELSIDMSGRHEYQLSNGLKVIIKEDHRSPVVMTQLWYKVGASDEPADKGGISHLLEHMMFKGTKNVSSQDFERIISKFGGVNNAFTSYDYTGYYEMFPANRLPLALELEADRMTNLLFDANEFAKERQVVMEERRQRTDDNPLAKASEKFRLFALPDSPKGESVIGPMAEIESISLDDLKQWYRTWYAPNNATLVIVGDVKPAEALAEVKRYFGDIKPSKLPKRPSVAQKGFRGYQQTTSKQAVKVPVLLMGYNVPTLLTAPMIPNKANPAYALSLVSDLLDGGLSARLEKSLVREQGLLTSVGASYNPLDRGDGLFVLQATPREGVSLQDAQKAIIAEINKIKTAPITDDELARAKTNTVTSLVYAQDSVTGQAMMIGSMQVIGLDDRLLSNLPAKLESVTISDLQNAAKKYLVDDNLTVMYVLPEETP